MDLIYVLLFIVIILAILIFIKNILSKNSGNDEDYEYDGNSSTKIRHGNL